MGRVVWSCLLVLGCTGELSVSNDDPIVDAGRRDTDARVPGSDGGPAADLGPGRDGGPAGADGGPTGGPCEGVSCGAGEVCDGASGECICAEGFVDMGGSCVAPPAGDPATRTLAEVCDEWDAGHQVDAPFDWFTADGMCGVGTVHEDVYGDIVRRASLFRWLAGLGPVTENVSQREAHRECAVMMSAAGDLSHDPDPDWPCYTAEGAQAAARSNLAARHGAPADMIDQLMKDCSRPPCPTGVGHRRWQLLYSLGSIGIGVADVEGGRWIGGCIGIANGGGTSERPWIAYPNPGPAPIQLTDALWSFHPGMSGFSISGGEASVTRVSDGMVMPVTSTTAGSFGFPPGAIVWSLDGWTAQAGETYRVTIAGLPGGDVTYDVDVVDCAAR